jgi:mRNA-degrading endonuclease RelE of RelBE toxin-antitoxin system
LKNLNLSSIQERVLRKIRWLSENFDDVTPQALTADLSGLFKLRVGDDRVIYAFDVETQLYDLTDIQLTRFGFTPSDRDRDPLISKCEF